jgi:hypothetical protein
MALTARATDNMVVPAGEYVGTLRAITEGSGQYGPTYEWDWEVQGPDGPVTISQRTSQKFSASSFARLWAQVLLGRPIVKDEVVDLESLIGRRARLEIAENKNGYSAIADIAESGADNDEVGF